MYHYIGGLGVAKYGGPQFATPMMTYVIQGVTEGERDWGDWIRFLLGWMPEDRVYCRTAANLTKLDLTLVPLTDNKSQGIKLAVISYPKLKLWYWNLDALRSFLAPQGPNETAYWHMYMTLHWVIRMSTSSQFPRRQAGRELLLFCQPHYRFIASWRRHSYFSGNNHRDAQAWRLWPDQTDQNAMIGHL